VGARVAASRSSDRSVDGSIAASWCRSGPSPARNCFTVLLAGPLDLPRPRRPSLSLGSVHDAHPRTHRASVARRRHLDAAGGPDRVSRCSSAGRAAGGRAGASPTLSSAPPSPRRRDWPMPAGQQVKTPGCEIGWRSVATLGPRASKFAGRTSRGRCA
jgi:hypothetical protein